MPQQYDYDDDYDDGYYDYDEYDDVPKAKPRTSTASQPRKSATPTPKPSAKGSSSKPPKPKGGPNLPQPSSGGAAPSSTAVFSSKTSEASTETAAGDRPSAGASARQSRASVGLLPPYRDPTEYEHPKDLQKLLKDHAKKKDVLHVVVLGHVDAGKSTLMGRLLHDLGYLDERQVRKNQQGAQAAGKASFGWAWAMDERDDERARGLTVDISMRRVCTARYAVTLLDAPGHQDFVPNLITGAAQADAALLVVDGSPGGFESGFGGKGASSSGSAAPVPGRSGQTREHVHVARSCGVKQLAVAVTKLDVCDYSKARFEEIKGKLGPFLKSCGFAVPQWLPVAAPAGENICKGPVDDRLAAWWPSGCSLVDVIDKFKPVARLTDLPFRMVVADVITKASLGGKAGVCGKVEAGAIAPGAQVLLMPRGAQATIRDVHVQGDSCAVTVAGDSVDVGLGDVDPAEIEVGSVLCPPEFPVHLVCHVQGRILVVGSARPIIPGQRMVMHMHSTSSPCRISKLLHLLDLKTGQPTKSGPALRMLKTDQAAVVELALDAPVCMEVLANGTTSLSRFVLRMNGIMIALGSILEILGDS